MDIFGNRPYDEYLKCKNDITRIEYRKNSRALRETERTLMEELVWVKNDAIKYINNMGIYIDDDIDLPRTYKKQEEMRIKREEEIINRAISNIEAYAHRLDMH
ncbi:MAG TPA: hypothetical protein VLF89_10315 [Candidatus Saccharimonadales bacterium]|nr:hypothetical protein [Candidatus Saccharimonadales bacterium]